MNSVCIINLIRLPKLLPVPTVDITCRSHPHCPLFFGFFVKELAIDNSLVETVTDIPITNWTAAEHHLGIVSACLPCFRPLFHGIRSIFSSHDHTSSNDKPSSGRPAQPRSAADVYKSLDGKETSMNGSKIALVPSDQWTVPPITPASVYDHSNAIKNKAVAESGVARPPRDDVELGLSPSNINVTREFDVSRSARL